MNNSKLLNDKINRADNTPTIYVAEGTSNSGGLLNVIEILERENQSLRVAFDFYKKMQLVLSGKSEKIIACFGAGDNLNNYFNFAGCKYISLIIDNNPKQETYGNIPVTNPAGVSDWNNLLIVVTNSKYYDEIKDQLIGYELKENEDFIYWRKLIAVV